MMKNVMNRESPMIIWFAGAPCNDNALRMNERTITIRVKLVINSDAHRPEEVGEFGRQIERALEAGLNETDVLNAEGCGRGMRMAGHGPGNREGGCTNWTSS